MHIALQNPLYWHLKEETATGESIYQYAFVRLIMSIKDKNMQVPILANKLLFYFISNTEL